jgi:dsDNA-specific endonuclease/ATPase MutS2
MSEEETTEETNQEEKPAIDPAQFTALQEELERFKAKHKEVEKHLKEKEKAAKQAAEDAAKKSGDVEALEKSWAEKLESATKERDQKLTEYQQMINKMTVGAESQRIASALAVPGSADVLLPHIEKRLSVDMSGDAPIIRVLDKDGKPSAQTLDELQKEIEASPAFAPLIVGSKANGTGGVGKKTVPGNDAIMKMSPMERMNAGRASKA